MLDPRVYRATFLPALLAFVVAAFALGSRPEPVTTSLEPAFDGTRAFGSVRAPARDSLLELARSFPDRAPGSAGDLAVADRVEAVLRRSRFNTRRLAATADGPDGEVDLQTVVGVRPGISSRRLVVLAHRDAAARGAAAELSGTAALLEIARVTAGADLTKTLVLVSTSGGSLDGGPALQWARDASDQVDAVLVLEQLAAAPHKPWVVPWTNGSKLAPIELRRTVEAAVRKETGSDPGGPRASAQWARLAVPFAFGEAPQIGRTGLPAVALSVSGERRPAADGALERACAASSASARACKRYRTRFVKFGRAAMRTVSALDDRAAPLDPPARRVVMRRKVLEPWVVRLLVGMLLFPLVVAAVDAFARARRKRLAAEAYVTWVLLGALPFALAFAWTRLLDLIGVVRAPGAPVPPGTFPVSVAGVGGFASAALLAVLAWFGLRRSVWRQLAPRGGLGTGGAGAALALVSALLGVAVWALNPYACAVLLPALHVCALLAAGEQRPRWPSALVSLAIALVPFVWLALYYGSALSLGAGALAWATWLALAGGQVGWPALGTLSLVLGLAGGVGAVMRARAAAEALPPEEPLQTRGPLTYAGPGSLGGTESALRR